MQAGRDLAEKVAGRLGLEVGEHEEREFEDGEHKARPLQSEAGNDVYIIQSLHGEPGFNANDKLLRVLFLAGAIRDAGAARLTVIAPYICYSRKDRRTKPFDPLTNRYVAQLFEAMSVDRVACLDAHNLAAFENAYRRPAVHLSAHAMFADYFSTAIAHDKPVAVASPDTGGIKRAGKFLEILERRLDRPVDFAFMEKRRSEGVVTGSKVVGEVKGRSVMLIDDLIASGGTLKRAAEAFLNAGAVEVFAAATHGIFGEKSDEILATPALKKIVISNSVPPARITSEIVRGKLDIVDISPVIAEMIGEYARPLLR